MKKSIKAFLSTLLFCMVFPLGYLAKSMQSDDLFLGFGQFFALFPGKFGSFIRIAYYRHTLDNGPNDGYIGFGSYFSHREAGIGQRVYIGAYCLLGKVLIEDDATIGSGVHILSGKHQHGFGNVDKPIQQQGGIFEQINIGKNCWIGNCATIMSDIGDNAVIGAATVVVQKIPPCSIAVGNPAKVVKQRK